MTSLFLRPLCLSGLLSLALLGCSGGEEAPAPPETSAIPVAPPPAPEAAPVPEAPAMTAVVGQPAPDFTLTDTDGNVVKLSSFAGKTVVLEWFNPGCPFVKYTHGEGPLKTLPGKITEGGVVWLAINSGAPGKQGHGLDTNKAARTEWGMNYPVLIDEEGKVGRMYGAKSTPHMFVIDDKGTLAYAGALDNAPMGKAEGGAVVNHVEQALTDLKAGTAVKTPTTQAYGCSVKYGDA